jgi:hypothetical protein
MRALYWLKSNGCASTQGQLLETNQKRKTFRKAFIVCTNVQNQNLDLGNRKSKLEFNVNDK